MPKKILKTSVHELGPSHFHGAAGTRHSGHLRRATTLAPRCFQAEPAVLAKSFHIKVCKYKTFFIIVYCYLLKLRHIFLYDLFLYIYIYLSLQVFSGTQEASTWMNMQHPWCWCDFNAQLSHWRAWGHNGLLRALVTAATSLTVASGCAYSQCEVATDASADALAWHLNAEGIRTTQQTICHIQHALQIVRGNGESNCAWHVCTRNLKYFGSFRSQSRWGRRSKRRRWRCRVAHQADDARRQMRNRCSCKPTLALKSITNAKNKSSTTDNVLLVLVGLCYKDMQSVGIIRFNSKIHKGQDWGNR